MESLSDRLKSLGVQVGIKTTPPSSTSRKGYPIEEVLSGFEHESQFGNTFYLKENYPSGYKVGDVELTPELNYTRLAQWAHLDSKSYSDIRNIAFIDTETSGLAGGTGTFPFLVGIGYFDQEKFCLLQLFMRDPGQEPALLATLSHFMTPFDTIVSFNGKSFDVPILNTRHILNGFSSPFVQLPHIDLLPLARRIWKDRLPSRALKSLEVDILNIGRTQEEVPGWMVPELYADYLHTADARPLAGVFYHNGMDILSLAGLFVYVGRLLQDPESFKEVPGLDMAAIARLNDEMGDFESAVQLYEKALAQGLPEEAVLLTLKRYAEIYKKKSLWESAVNLWKKASDLGDLDACIELAKYYEHQCKDYPSAMTWTENADAICKKSKISRFEKAEFQKEFSHRLERLKKKQNSIQS